MRLENIDLRLTDHAYAQYCKRVGQETREEIRDSVIQALTTGKAYRKAEFLQIDGIWWVFERNGSMIVLVTCYGRSSFDLPAAKKWAHLHNDRIDLTGGEVLCNG